MGYFPQSFTGEKHAYDGGFVVGKLKKRQSTFS
jgi:hypothetical protein